MDVTTPSVDKACEEAGGRMKYLQVCKSFASEVAIPKEMWAILSS
jgi:hypothetical protein